MLQRLHKSLEKRDEGFTLIELLVVMIIIGILAAIAIPVFLNQRNKGYDSQAKSDLRNLATSEETYLDDHAAYIGGDAAALHLAMPGWSKSANVTTVAATVVGGNQSWWATAQSAAGNDFCYNSANSGAGVVSGATC
jgi:type IV pilus assembly protein PilA